MIRDQSSKQTVFDFYLPFGGTLEATNRWVKPAETIPWDGNFVQFITAACIPPWASLLRHRVLSLV